MGVMLTGLLRISTNCLLIRRATPQEETHACFSKSGQEPLVGEVSGSSRDSSIVDFAKQPCCPTVFQVLLFIPQSADPIAVS